jgi:hypothetical protein
MQQSSNTTDSQAAGAPEPLRFAMVPIDKLALPEELFSRDIAAEDTSLMLVIPLVVWQTEDSYAVIDGCKRLAAAAAQGRAQCACAIIEAPYDTARAGLLRIGLNAARDLHLREKFLFIRWLHTHLEGEAYIAEAQKLRIAAPERHDLEQLAACSPLLIDAALQGTIDIAVAPDMTHLSEADAQALIGLFSEIGFSRQMQRELAEWLHEIAFTERFSLAQLLAAQPIADIVADPRLNAPQKAARIHGLAHERRFPLYTKAKKSWAAHARKINPDPRMVQFQPTPFFEKKSLEVRLKLSDGAAAKRLAAQLAAISVEEWEELIDPTRFLK